MKTKILSIFSAGILAAAITTTSFVPFAYAQTCTQNCDNNRTARIYKCETYSTDKGIKNCIASAHKTYARCAGYCGKYK